ncbi:hypothetical protein [Pseudorhodoferax soli]|uniref:Uncharacterized protein n=1 Tax=Pseudorhodoferax soli TaxID=545864 RepID=A0A368XZA9_9BURK|nr:hypothetical protein [Pseudorhodoferax soli]RCW72486.1 hypothetical protein DES41_10391 [Pseudorhodoferax soli]
MKTGLCLALTSVHALPRAPAAGVDAGGQTISAAHGPRKEDLRQHLPPSAPGRGACAAGFFLPEKPV